MKPHIIWSMPLHARCFLSFLDGITTGCLIGSGAPMHRMNFLLYRPHKRGLSTESGTKGLRAFTHLASVLDTILGWHTSIGPDTIVSEVSCNSHTHMASRLAYQHLVQTEFCLQCFLD